MTRVEEEAETTSVKKAAGAVPNLLPSLMLISDEAAKQTFSLTFPLMFFLVSGQR